MRLPSTRDRRTWLGLLLLAPLFALLAWRQQAMAIDAENRALKAPDTAEAALTRRLAERFGSESMLVLAFGRPDGRALTAADRDALDAVREDLRERPEVERPPEFAEPKPGTGLLLVPLREHADALALVALARTQCPGDLRFLASGLPLLEQAIAAGVRRDRDRVVPAIALALFALCLWLYRSLSQSLAVLLPPVLSIFGTGGAAELLGHRVDPVLVLLDPVLLTIGVATSVHYLGAFRRHRARGCAPASAARRATHDIRWPLLFTTATKMLGFGSLSLHPIPAVAAFGAFAALGTGLVHLLVLVILPNWLRALPGPPPPPSQPLRAAAFAGWLQRRRRLVLAGSTALALGGAAGWLALHVDNDPLTVLPTDDPARQAHEQLAARIGGAETFALLVDRGSPLQQFDRMLPFTALALQAPAVGPAGPLRRADDSTLLLPVLLEPSGSRARQARFAAIDRAARALGYGGVHCAGLAVQIAADSHRLVRGQLAGLGITLLGLWLGLTAMFRSLRLGLVGIVPTAIPCVLLYGGLGWLGQPLTFANAMIGACMLGLIVNNTIHLLHRFRNASGEPADRLTAALARTGTPILISSAVLALGFSTGACGTMNTTVEFAGMAALTIVLGSACTLLVLPALLLGAPPSGPGERA